MKNNNRRVILKEDLSMGMFTEIHYEVDLRDRKTGNSVECIYSGTKHDEAYEIADKWNREHGLGELQEKYESYEELCDGSDGLFADVYHVEDKENLHGVGKYETME